MVQREILAMYVIKLINKSVLPKTLWICIPCYEAVAQRFA